MIVLDPFLLICGLNTLAIPELMGAINFGITGVYPFPTLQNWITLCYTFFIKWIKMKIFKYRVFRKWAKKEGVSDSNLKKAIEDIGNGLFDANLGNGLYKQRVARKGWGKRGGYRTILAFKENDKSIFMYGYAKNDCANISDKEEAVYKKLARYYLEATDRQIENLIKIGELFEVN